MPFLLASSEKLYVFKTPWFTGFWGCWKLLKARKFIVTPFAHAQTLGCCVIYQLLGYITYVIYSIWISSTHWVDPCITNSSSLPTSVTEGKKKVSRFRSLDKSFFTPFFKLIYSFWGSRFVGTPVFFYRSEKIAKTISALMLRFYFLTYVSTREVNFR